MPEGRWQSTGRLFRDTRSLDHRVWPPLFGLPADSIIGQVDGKPKRVTLELGDPHYHLAILAHDQEKAIRCVGSLVREGRGFVLHDPRDVALEEE
jgi:hypothetical protein